MPEQEFSNREIDSFFKKIDEKLERIETQTTKTNGHVADISEWRQRVNGGALVASAFMTIVIIPMFSWCIYTMLHLDDSISKGISDALENYDHQQMMKNQ